MVSSLAKSGASSNHVIFGGSTAYDAWFRLCMCPASRRINKTGAGGNDPTLIDEVTV